MNNLLIFIKLNCSAPAVQPAISFVEDIPCTEIPT